MSGNAQPGLAKAPTSTPIQPSASGMRGDIQQKWGKFDAQEIAAQEIAALKDKDDLVAQVQVKYAIDKSQAQRDVDAFANGRQL